VDSDKEVYKTVSGQIFARITHWHSVLPTLLGQTLHYAFKKLSPRTVQIPCHCRPIQGGGVGQLLVRWLRSTYLIETVPGYYLDG